MSTKRKATKSRAPTKATDITVVLDRSGSMLPLKADTIGGFNNFLTEQRKVSGTCSISLVRFDHEYEAVYTEQPVKTAPLLDDSTYQPRSTTALLDAVGRTIQNTAARVGKMKRAPRVLFVIITDGQENSSVELTKSQVKDLIESRTKLDGWDFIFLGANQDAFYEGGRIGINAYGKTLSTANTPVGVAQAFASVSGYTTRARSSVSDASFASNTFTTDDRKKQQDAGSGDSNRTT